MTMARRITVYGIFFVILVVFIFVVLFLIRMWFPDGLGGLFNFGQANRNNFTRYYGPDVEAILQHRHIMIDAGNTDVEIRIRKPGQFEMGEDGVGTMVIREDARNNRSWLEWTQVFVDNDTFTNQLFYRVVIHEGSTAFQRRPLLVLNLSEDDFDIDNPFFRPYSFIFNMGAGSVTFSFDPDVQQTLENVLLGTIEIGSGATGIYRFPAPRTVAGHTFTVEIDNLVINESDIVVSAAHVPIRESLVINSRYGNFTVGDVGDSITVANGNYIILHAGGIAGDVNVNTTMGRVSASGIVSGHVTMSTWSGSLSVLRIQGDLTFSTTFNGTATVTYLVGNVNFTSTDRGLLSLSQIQGFAIVNAHQSAITLGGTRAVDGMYGDVTVVNNYGSTVVRFATAAISPITHITGVDSHVTVTGVRGQIFVGLTGTTGRGNISASFHEISASTNILENLGLGNINISLITTLGANPPFMPFHLRVENTEQARDRTGWAVHAPWMDAPVAGNTGIGNIIDNYNRPPPYHGRLWPVQNPTNTSHILTARTSNAVELRAV